MMKTVETMVTGADRREWLRIDDRVLFQFKRVGDGLMAHAGSTVDFSACHEFIAKPTNDLLAEAGERDLQLFLAPWLMKIDWAMSLVLSTLARTAPGGIPLPRMTDVNLSATGVSFPTACELKEGDRLELTLILPPFTPIHAAGEVSRVTPLTGSEKPRYLAAVRFDASSADSQEHLIRHILRVQAERQRARQQYVAL